ncbi:unnamed protein product [Moneuplotes crassus]|uniref:Uncharacterized protein n=1 Tax=Euplotes crassus TaxID=5936 RepID=A0AAD1Y7R2_EUPCR|nr:unnamed protein product [Moneuplotes crassus]
MGVNYEDIFATCKEASQLMRRLRGRILIYDILSIFLLCGLLWVMLAICIILGIFIGFIWGTLIFLAYACAVGNFAFWSRRKSTRYLRIAHFVLAVYLRAENNRFYMNKHVMLRPGYCAKWIEFIIDRKYMPRDLKEELNNEQNQDMDEMDMNIMERNLAVGNARRRSERILMQNEHYLSSSSEEDD